MKFALAYVFWLVILAAIVFGLWFAGSELSAFRYAGF